MSSYPHPCGATFRDAVAQGTEPAVVVPNDFTVVHGGMAALPPSGIIFSCAAGPTLDAAACAVPHGQIRVSTVGAIRALGGTVIWVPQRSRLGTINDQHVNVVESGTTTFGSLIPNPVSRKSRVDGKP